jgi:2-oxo-4-hydroxy-4-carboxy--5-ureidoimidazoline (OHCU) decarboxylase
MMTVTISVSDEHLAKLRSIGKQTGLTAEELLQQWIARLIERRDEEFRKAMEEVLEIRAELYRRLANM